MGTIETLLKISELTAARFKLKHAANYITTTRIKEGNFEALIALESIGLIYKKDDELREEIIALCRLHNGDYIFDEERFIQ